MNSEHEFHGTIVLERLPVRPTNQPPKMAHQPNQTVNHFLQMIKSHAVGQKYDNDFGKQLKQVLQPFGIDVSYYIDSKLAEHTKKPTTEQNANGTYMKTSHGVVCDGCNGFVIDMRFKCKKCLDFNLRSTCAAKSMHSEHEFDDISMYQKSETKSEDVSAEHTLTLSKQKEATASNSSSSSAYGGSIRFHNDLVSYDKSKTKSESVSKTEQAFTESKRTEVTASNGRSAYNDHILHYGVACDGCNGNIAGSRYKCKQCPNFDLCSLCKAKSVHSEHEFDEIRGPGRLPERPTNQPPNMAHQLNVTMNDFLQTSKPHAVDKLYQTDFGEYTKKFLQPFGIEVSYYA